MSGLPHRRGMLVAVALLAACAAVRPAADGAAAADELASAELAFAAAATRDGVQAAFLGALADDSTLFRPGPVDGKAFTGQRPDPPIRLEWRPQRVAVSTSGDLGFSTGPWRLAAKATPDAFEYGQFFSVWRRDPAGRWQVLFDHGIGHAGPLGWELPLERLAAAREPLPAGDVAGAEKDFARVSMLRGAAEAYREFASPSVRLLREGLAPLDGRASIDRLPEAAAARWWTTDRSGLAAAGDFAWVTGRYRDEGSNRSGFFVRVWRAEGGRWAVVADVLAPVERAAP